MSLSSKQHNCKHCGKQYTRKTSYNRHYILCEIVHQSNSQSPWEKQCEEEETTSVPSVKHLYTIIQELAIKYQNLEEKMNNVQKWVETKKRKLNVIQWLNANREPNIDLQTWIKSIQVNEEHIEILIEHNMIKTINDIFKKKISSAKDSAYIHPIFGLTQKENLLYCYNSFEEKWIKLSTDELIIILKNIHRKILIALCEWRDKNSDRINSSDKMEILYNKTMIKLMSVNFTQDSQILSKARSELYNNVKTDLKHLVEYEFEF